MVGGIGGGFGRLKFIGVFEHINVLTLFGRVYSVLRWFGVRRAASAAIVCASLCAAHAVARGRICEIGRAEDMLPLMNDTDYANPSRRTR